METSDWVEKIRQGDVRALARALSQIENHGPRCEPLLRALFPYSGRAWRLGVTGSPGAGKSSLVNRLAARLRHEEQSIAIVAVDPSSPFSGGSILGDRVRMQSHCADPGVFIRSMATRGSLGGLAPATADVMLALEAAGRDVVMIETVGVGQDEIEVVKLAPVVTVVLTPSMGDDVQMIKAGIMEIADVFVINKSDQPGAGRVQQQLEAMLSLAPASAKPAPAIVRTVATEDNGIAEWLQALRSRPRNEEKAVDHWRQRLLDLLRQRLVEQLMGNHLSDDELNRAAREVAERRLNPYEYVREILTKAGVG